MKRCRVELLTFTR